MVVLASTARERGSCDVAEAGATHPVANIAPSSPVPAATADSMVSGRHDSRTADMWPEDRACLSPTGAIGRSFSARATNAVPCVGGLGYGLHVSLNLIEARTRSALLHDVSSQ